jgi:cytosine/adenosine deaminase-related metal-dependent hydrolase
MTAAPSRAIDCVYLIAGPSAPIAARQTIRIDGGKITAVAGMSGAPESSLLAMPALVNAHDHARARSCGRTGLLISSCICVMKS